METSPQSELAWSLGEERTRVQEGTLGLLHYTLLNVFG